MRVLFVGPERQGNLIRDTICTRWQAEITITDTNRELVMEVYERILPEIVLLYFFGSSSYTLISLMQAHTHHAPIISVSSSFKEWTALMVEVLGMQGYITTIMDEAVMLDIIERVLRGETAVPPDKASCREKIG